MLRIRGSAVPAATTLASRAMSTWNGRPTMLSAFPPGGTTSRKGSCPFHVPTDWRSTADAASQGDGAFDVAALGALAVSDGGFPLEQESTSAVSAPWAYEKLGDA